MNAQKEWPKRRLDELTEPARPITYGVVKPGDHDDLNGVRFIRGGDIAEGKINISNLRTITSEVSAGYKRTLLRGGEVVVSLVGNPGEAAVVPASLAGANIARQTGLVALRDDVDSRYVMYFLRSPGGRAELFAQTTGSVQQVINLANLKNIRVPLPDLTTQRKIAGILSTYDDLIENNLRRIKILEEMAQSLYREWFVHFRFPGHESTSFTASSMGPIPKGWIVKPVEAVLKRLKAGTVYKKNDVSDSGSIPVIDQSTDLVLGYHQNKPDHQATASGPIAIFGDHTCKIQLMTEPFSIGPNVIPFVASGNLPLFYVYFLIRDLASTQEYKRHWIQLNSNEVGVTTNEIAERFHTFVQPIFEQFQLLQKQNQTLRRTRDLLLPQLLSQ